MVETIQCTVVESETYTKYNIKVSGDLLFNWERGSQETSEINIFLQKQALKNRNQSLKNK